MSALVPGDCHARPRPSRRPRGIGARCGAGRNHPRPFRAGYRQRLLCTALRRRPSGEEPRQRVRHIAFDYKPEASAEARKVTGPRTFGVAVIFRDKADGDGGAVAYCKDGPGRVTCDAEGDAGSFEVTSAGPDRIRITMTRGLGFENDTRKGYVSLEDGPDDKVFLLRKAPLKACDILR